MLSLRACRDSEPSWPFGVTSSHLRFFVEPMPFFLNGRSLTANDHGWNNNAALAKHGATSATIGGASFGESATDR